MNTNENFKTKVLVVDDEPLMKTLILKCFKQQISENKLDFLFAGNGYDALEVIQKNPGIGIILTDIRMPEMDGLTLLECLIKQNRLFRTAVISAYADMHNIRLAMNRGASDFIIKPIDLEDLRSTLSKLITEYFEIKNGLVAREKMIGINNELKIAQNIQREFIPTHFNPFPNNQNIELIGEMIPAKEIGGDFFDFIALDDHRLGFFIADVTGKGIPAALFMSMSRILIRSTAISGYSCDQCMIKSNSILCEKNESNMCVTTFFGWLDINTGEIHYCNAGHNPPLIFSNNTVRAIGRNEGLLLGVDTEHDYLYKEKTDVLKKGDLIVLYTDGVTEAMSSDRKEFYTENRLKTLIEKNGSKPIAELLKIITEDIRNFSVGSSQSDDFALLLIRYKGTP
jgi:phosphoserine phosphatase RsbU/P